MHDLLMLVLTSLSALILDYIHKYPKLSKTVVEKSIELLLHANSINSALNHPFMLLLAI